jgi:hypothetical protein
MDLTDLRFYLIRNSDGKYFRRKGYRGYGDSWETNLGKVRIYTKLSSARSVVTFFANNYKDFLAPVIVEIAPGEITEIDESERLAQVRDKKAKRETINETIRRGHALKDAERQLVETMRKLEELNG